MKDITFVGERARKNGYMGTHVASFVMIMFNQTQPSTRAG